jgi:hypothetical protein
MKSDGSYSQDLTLFAISIVVTMSDLFVKQEGYISRSYFGVFILAAKVRNLLRQCSLVLLRKRCGRDFDFLPG